MKSLFKVIAAMVALGPSIAEASDFSLSGFALGMTPDQVTASAKQLYADPGLEFRNWKIDGGASWAANGTLFFADRSRPETTERDEMKFAFTGLGSGNRLFALSREYLFDAEKKPTPKSVYEALEKKFGKPTSFSSDPRANIWASWAFKGEGTEAVKQEPYGNCEKMPVSLGQSEVNVAKICGLSIFLAISANSMGLAEQYRFTMTDYRNAATDFDADQKRMKDLSDEARKAAATQAAAPPKL